MFLMVSVPIAMVQYNVRAFVKRFDAYETIGGLFREESGQTLELTIAGRIWQLFLDIADTISEVVDLGADQMAEAIINGNEKIAGIYSAICSANAA